MTAAERPVQAAPRPTPASDGNGKRPARRGPRIAGRRVLWAAVTVGLAAAVGVFLYTRGGSGEDTTADAEPTTTTAAVERRDLVETESVDGTLAYTGSRAVIYLDAGTSSSAATSSNASYEGAAPATDGAAVSIAYLGAGDDGETAPPPPPPTDTVPTDETSTDTAPTDTTPTDTTPTDTTPTDTTPTDTTPTDTIPTETAPTETIPTDTTPTDTIPTETTPSAGVPSGGTASGAQAGSASGATTSSSSTSGPGIVTWLPKEGATIEPGKLLYRVDGKPTVLMAGKLPAWRTLKTGVADGPDVRELERNLVALGYDPGGKIVVDEHFGPATKAAVKRWQKALGISQTGAVRLGRVVFLPGARRVSSLETEVGARVQSGTTMMETTSTRQIVTVALATTKQTLVAVGDAVTVGLPGGDDVEGEIVAIGKVATSTSTDTTAQGGQGGAATSSSATIDVEIRLTGETGIDLDQAPVDVEISRQTRQGVLAVPVTALVALAGGGYAVEVPDGAATRLVAVEPGLYADGYVEIEGDGIEEGTDVVVPA